LGSTSDREAINTLSEILITNKVGRGNHEDERIPIKGKMRPFLCSETFKRSKCSMSRRDIGHVEERLRTYGTTRRQEGQGKCRSKGLGEQLKIVFQAYLYKNGRRKGGVIEYSRTREEGDQSRQALQI